MLQQIDFFHMSVDRLILPVSTALTPSRWYNSKKKTQYLFMVDWIWITLRMCVCFCKQNNIHIHTIRSICTNTHQNRSAYYFIQKASVLRLLTISSLSFLIWYLISNIILNKYTIIHGILREMGRRARVEVYYSLYVINNKVSK